jgi:uncharacterized delta-60 repeat protein
MKHSFGRLRAFPSATMLAGFLFALNLLAQPGFLDDGFYPVFFPDRAGPVHAIAVQPDGKILIAGLFSRPDPYRIVRLNEDGTRDPSFAAGAVANQDIMCTLIDSDGRILIGGSFLEVQGVPLNGIARLKKDGSIDSSFVPELGIENVVAIAMEKDGRILIGGYFQMVVAVDGVQHSGIARLNVDGSLDESFKAAFAGNPGIDAFAEQTDGKIITVQNRFQGTLQSRVVRLENDGTLDSSFNPSVDADDSIRAIAIQRDGKVLLGGRFTTLAGESFNGIGRLNTDGTPDSSFTPGTGLAGGEAASFAIQNDGKIIVGGTFTSINGVPRSRIARLNDDGTVDQNFDPGLGVEYVAGGVTANVSVSSTALQADGRILIGGFFNQVDGKYREQVARLGGGEGVPLAPSITIEPEDQNVTLGQTASFSVVASGFPRPTLQWYFGASALPLQRGNALILSSAQSTNAGRYMVVVSNSVGSVTSVVATLTVNPPPASPGALDLSFDAGTGVDGSVHAIALQPGNEIIIGGYLSRAPKLNVNCIARLHSNGVRDVNFADLGANNTINTISSLALDFNGKLILGGTFTSLNDVALTNVARIEADGQVDPTFAASLDIDGPVSAIATTPESKVMIVGEFTEIAGIFRNRIARLNPDGTLDETFDPGSGIDGTNAPVLTSVAIDAKNKIVIGGRFQRLNGNARSGIARLNPDGSADPTFNPVGVGGAYPVIRAIAIQPWDGKILIGGEFTSVNNLDRKAVARLNLDGSVDESFTPDVAIKIPSVQCLALQGDGKIFIGGFTLSADGAVALLTSQGALDDVFDRNLSTDDGITCLAIQEDGNVLIGGGFSRVNGVPRDSVARIFGRPPTSRPTLSGVLFRSGAFSCQSPTLAGKKYTLQFKDSVELNGWNSFPAVSGDGTTKTFSDSNPPLTRRFYRLLSE